MLLQGNSYLSVLKRSAKLYIAFILPLPMGVIPILAIAEIDKLHPVYPLDHLLNIKVVTVASGYEENSLDVGSSVDVVSPAEWRSRGSHSIWEAMWHLPGMSINTNSTASEGLTYRGISIVPGSRGTSMIIDGVPINNQLFSTGFYHANNIGLGTLARIEVIQGPGSALYGADAFQGVLYLHTKKEDFYENEIDVSAGSSEYRHVTATLAQSSGDNVAGFSFDINESNPELNYLYDSANSDPNSPNRNTSFDMYLPQQTLTFTAFETYSPSEHLAITASVLGNFMERSLRRSASGSSARFVEHETEFKMAQATMEYVGFNDIKFEFQVYRWSGEFSWDFATQDTVTDTEISNIRFRFDGLEEKTGADFRIRSSPLKEGVRWQLGLSGSSAELDHFDKGLTSGPLVPDTLNGYTRDLTSIYGEVKVPLLKDNLNFIIGGRRDDYSDFGQRFSPRLAAIYRLSETSRLKFLWGNAFRAPSSAELGSVGAPNVAAPFGNPSIEPEIIDTYEWVYMQNWENQSIETILFYNEIKEGINLIPMPTDDPRYFTDGIQESHIYVNGSDSVSHGFVIKYSVRFNRWQLDSNVSYADGMNLSADIDYHTYPTWIANVLVAYEWDRSLKLIVANRVAFDTKTRPEAASSDLEDYYRTDINLTQTIGEQFEVRFDIRNLLDSNRLVVSGTSAESWEPEEGISAWLSGRYSF